MLQPGTLQPGSLFAGRYEILRCIGQGGMGAVYEAVHRETQRRRALKILLPMLVSDHEARARFAQEASITAEIESEHLVEIFDAGVDAGSGCPFIVMELLRGETLGERLARKQRTDPGDVVEILRQVALVLEQTHRRGIVHRDLKPDNLFLARREDGTCRVKVLDFGIAKVCESAALTRNTVNIGTPLYMAPEQLDGSRLGPATDLFSLTHIAYELYTGESYWEEEVRTAPSTMVLLKWMEKGPPEPPRVRAARLGCNVGLDFDEWFLRGIATNPAARFSSARELAEKFARAVRLPLSSLDVGRLSLTGLLPPAPMSRPGERASVPDAVPGSHRVATAEGPTLPRGIAPRRSQGPFVSQVDPSRGRRSPLLIAIGAGVLVATLIGALLLFFALRTKPAASAASRSTSDEAEEAVATQAALVTASAVTTSSSDVSASASVSAKPSAKPVVKPVVRPRGRHDCVKHPDRCRD